MGPPVATTITRKGPGMSDPATHTKERGAMTIDLEEIRAAFWRVTRVDINHLEPDEIHDLIEILPLTVVALHQIYLTPPDEES